MANNTVTRTDLVEAIHEEVGLPRTECAELLEDVLIIITDHLVRGETVKVSNFGSFTVRHKAKRVGQNPKTGEKYPIAPRKVIVFRPSIKFRHWVNHPDDFPRLLSKVVQPWSEFRPL